MGAKFGLSITSHPGVRHPANDAATVGALKDAQSAYADLAARPARVWLGNADLDGTTVTPGVYHSASALTPANTVVFDAQNNPDAVFILQTDASIYTVPSSKMLLINGAKASNIYWLAGTTVTLGAHSKFIGNILSNGTIIVGSDSIVDGRTISINGSVALRESCVISAGITSPLTGSH